jgi:Protein of unknown function (DUF1698)
MVQSVVLPSQTSDLDLSILDQYIKVAPDPQLALNIFQDEWASKLPEIYGLNAGRIPLFEDTRIIWMIEQLGGITGKKVLELGPLEAGHTYMMEQLGADSITAIESNTRAYLKCLVIKELLGLKRASFLLGDIIEYLKQQSAVFDICVASGVLYHMANPAELIHLISKTANQVFIWTHYYDEAIIQANPQLAPRFSAASFMNYENFRHVVYQQEYGDALGYAGFCGGSRPFSSWMKREDILTCLKFFGFSDIRIGSEIVDHPHGPCFSLVASR